MGTFDDFRDEMTRRVVAMNAVLAADDVWPGLLCVEERDGSVAIAAVIPLQGMTDAQKQLLARVVLPGRIRDSGADRFCWVMPGDGLEPGEPAEYLVLVIGEGGRAQAALAPVSRDGSASPKLGPWRITASVSGLFVEPLLAALEPALDIEPIASLEGLL
jgi:hypothetical protein